MKAASIRPASRASGSRLRRRRGGEGGKGEEGEKGEREVAHGVEGYLALREWLHEEIEPCQMPASSP